MGRFHDELGVAMRPMTADALVRSGVTPRALQGPRWLRTSHGYYRPVGPPNPSPTQRILDAAVGLPVDARIGGWAAAYAQGADTLDGEGRGARAVPVPIVLPPGLRRLSTSTVQYIQHARRDIVPRPVVTIGGLRLTDPLQTALDLARWSSDLVDAVVALDALLEARTVTPIELEAAEAMLSGARGARQARRAIELSQLGVLSPWESRLRLFWVLELELPTPLVNRPVFDLSGRFLGVPDLLDEASGLAMEYDGTAWRSDLKPSGHRDPDQHREDNVREELLERSGLIVLRADKVDLTRERRRLRQRLLAARADGLRRDRTRDRWTIQTPRPGSDCRPRPREK
jgi:hypothetical protein